MELDFPVKGVSRGGVGIDAGAHSSFQPDSGTLADEPPVSAELITLTVSGAPAAAMEARLLPTWWRVLGRDTAADPEPVFRGTTDRD